MQNWFWVSIILEVNYETKKSRNVWLGKMHSTIQMDKNIILSNYPSKIADKNMILSISPSKVVDPTVVFQKKWQRSQRQNFKV